VTHAFKHAVRTPRPEQDRDSDDEAVAAARAKACAAYTEARECDEGRVRRVLRRLRADAASESLAHWDAIVQALEALDALNARTRAYAARVVGDEKADRLGRRHYSLALFEDEQDDEGDELPNIGADLLSTAEAHGKEARRIDLATTTSYEGETHRNAQKGVPMLDAVHPYDQFAHDQDADEEEAGLPGAAALRGRHCSQRRVLFLVLLLF
jgi:hypothetical protein